MSSVASSDRYRIRRKPAAMILIGAKLILLIALWLLACSGLAGEVALPEAEPDVAPSELRWGPLGERIAPLEPDARRSAEDREELRALSLYATGRTLLGRDDLTGALRHYQRAWRWDVDATNVLKEIVALAFTLERPQVAVRYALILAENGDVDPLLLRRLALYVTEEGDWARSLTLYQLWLDHPQTNLERGALDALLVELEVGRLSYVVGDFERASRFLGDFQRSVLTDGETGKSMAKVRRALGDDLNATWELCAMVHLAAKKYGLAAQAIDQIDVPLSEAGRLGFYRAQISLSNSDPTSAWEHLRSYFRAGHIGDGVAPYQLLAQVMDRLNQRDAYLLELAKLRAEDSHHPAVALALARELVNQQDVQRAIPLYRSVVDQAESVPAELGSAALVELIQLYVTNGAVRPLYKTLPKWTSGYETHEGLADVLSEISKHPGLVDRLVDLSDSEGDHAASEELIALSGLLLSAGRADEAATMFRRAVAAHPEQSGELHLGWGIALYAADEYEHAVNVFERAMQRDLPAESLALIQYYLSAAFELAGRTENALAVAHSLSDSHPDKVDYAARPPWVLYHAGRHAEAIRAYEAFIAHFEKGRESETRDALREARFVLSNLYSLEGNPAQGAETLELILDEFPDDHGAMNDLAFLWIDELSKNDLAYLRQARRFVERAVAEEPKNAAFRDSLGWVLYREGNFAGAVRELTEAVVLSRTSTDSGQADGIILDHLGDAHLKLGNLAAAAEWWTLALSRLEEEASNLKAKVEEKLKRYASDAPSSK